MREPLGKRSAFGKAPARSVKRKAGRTAVAETPLAVRTLGVARDEALTKRVRKRLGTKLGKFASSIERLTVRFADDNGPRGGIDKVCSVKVVLSGLDSVVFESRAGDVEQALSLAATGIERAVRRALGRSATAARTAPRPRPR